MNEGDLGFCKFCDKKLTVKETYGLNPATQTHCQRCPDRDKHVLRKILVFRKFEWPPEPTSSSQRWRKANPEKVRAVYLAQYYSHKVQILYECPCDNGKKHGHHFDYDRPFEVFRLCPNCHRAEHVRLRKLQQPAPITPHRKETSWPG